MLISPRAIMDSKSAMENPGIPGVRRDAFPLPLWERKGPTEGGKVRGAASPIYHWLIELFLPAFRP
jgi:hypothetical protein